MTDPTPNSVVQNQAANEFQLELGEAMGVLRYRIAGGVIEMFSVEVPIAHRNKGHAGEITKTALEFAKANNLKVDPICPYVQAYIQRHPEYASLIVGAQQKP